MNSNRTVISSMVGAAVVITLLAPNFAGAAASNKDVRVINTPAEAVPVSLSSNDVEVANTAQNPIPVTSVDPQAVREPIQIMLTLSFGSDALFDTAKFAVPTGKTLFVEWISGKWAHDNELKELELYTSFGDDFRFFSVPIHRDPGGPDIVNEEGRLMVPGGEDLTLRGVVDDPPVPTVDQPIPVTISGYLVDV